MTRICNKIRRIVRKIRSKMNQGEVAKLLEMNHTTVHYIWKKYLCKDVEDKERIRRPNISTERD